VKDEKVVHQAVLKVEMRAMVVLLGLAKEQQAVQLLIFQEKVEMANLRIRKGEILQPTQSISLEKAQKVKVLELPMD
jgi:hypothetical protein